MTETDQSKYWNGDTGQRWVAFSSELDEMMRPFADSVLSTANIQPLERVLDIGCGAGALSIMARTVGKEVLGVDISKPMLGLAQQRTENIAGIDFRAADASHMSLDKKYDVALSRFGVMFFEDPVAAFQNIRTQLTDNGRIAFACWQSPQKNDWANASLKAAMPFLKTPPEPPLPHAAGPFAFADSGYLTDVLQKAGWKSVEVSDWTGDLRLPGKQASDVADFMMEMGPLSRLLKGQNLDLQPVRQALINDLEKQANEDGTVDMKGAAWIVNAEV